VVAGLACSGPAFPRAARAGAVFYAGSVEFATGDYVFTDRTNSVYVFNGLSIAVGPATVSASLPVIYQNTALVSNSGPGMVPTGGGMGGGTSPHQHGGMMAASASPTAESFDHVGVGDPLLRVDVNVAGGRLEAYSVGVAATIKPPVADADRGFGTGEWDYGGGLTARCTVDRYTGSAELSYWSLGEPDGATFDNPVAYSAAVFRRFGNGGMSAGASVSGFTRVIDGVDPYRQIGVTLMYLPRARRSLSATVLFGMSDSAPDVGFSLGWGIAFGGA